MATIDLKNCTFIIKDGTASTPLTLEIKIGQGNFTYSEKKNMEYVLNRGKLDTVREGDEVPMDVSFDFQWEFLRSETSTPVSPEEALKKIGGASAWVSTGAECEPYAVDIQIKQNVTCGTTQDELYEFTDFRWESLDHDIKAGTISCKGKCNALSPTITRTTFA